MPIDAILRIDVVIENLDGLIASNLDCIKAIGETGLDYFREKDPRELQCNFIL